MLPEDGEEIVMTRGGVGGGMRWAPLSPQCFDNSGKDNKYHVSGWYSQDGPHPIAAPEYPNTSPFRPSHSAGPCQPESLQLLLSHLLLGPSTSRYHLVDGPKEHPATLPQSLSPWQPLWISLVRSLCAFLLSPLFLLSYLFLFIL